MQGSADPLLPAVFLPGRPAEYPGTLARFLPPLPDGIVSEWLQSNAPPGSLILDPFGTAPRLAAEAAQAGYRVLVSANNPIARFLLELYGNPAGADEYRSALADLASTRRANERLEPHIRALYVTRCDHCRSEIEAQAFIWERGSSAPIAKVYQCPYCGESDVHDVDEKDIARAEELSGDKLHRARALERVAAVDDTERGNVEEALNTYLPRAVYVLFTLINKLDGMVLPSERKKNLDALLLHAFDQANSLWAHPAGRLRPRQLSVPPRFRENNIWNALENAIEELPQIWQPDKGVGKGFTKYPVLTWPDLPPSSGGISIFEGRLRDLVDSLTGVEIGGAIGAVIGAIPRPNQAFWTLSALWAGWLWGKEAVGPFRSVLRRRRYDWSWHVTALHSAMQALNGVLSDGAPVLGLIGEAEPGYISSALIAAQTAGFTLRGLAMRAESGQAQLHWEKPLRSRLLRTASDQQLINQASGAAQELLRQRGEPAGYLHIHTAAMASLVRDNDLMRAGRGKNEPDLAPAEILTATGEIFEAAFTYRGGLLRYGGSDKSLEIGQWWLRPEGEGKGQMELALADRAEVELVRFLLKSPGSTYFEIDRFLCEAFPGLLTPSSELIGSLLESYGQQVSSEGEWQIRAEDRPRGRRNDLEAIRQALVQMGARFGFTSEGERPLLWLDYGDEPAVDESLSEGVLLSDTEVTQIAGQPPAGDELVRYVFYLIASGAIGEIVDKNPYPTNKSILVIPGSRAGLLLYKLKRNPHLSQAIDSGWRFLKFRHIYRLSKNPSLNRKNLDENLSLDPLQGETGQMRLL